MDRDRVLFEVRTALADAVIVCQLGDASNALFQLCDSELTLYLLGSMGMVIPTALGLSLGTERRVVAIEGDGGCLMNLGALTTVGRYAGQNLTVLVLDNESYESTGGQLSATSCSVDLAAVAAACGISHIQSFDYSDVGELVSWVERPGLRFALVKTQKVARVYPFVSLNPTAMTQRLSSRLLQNRP